MFGSTTRGAFGSPWSEHSAVLIVMRFDVFVAFHSI